MSNISQYRPWGILQWVLNHSPSLNFSLMGCLGTEERSLSVWQQLLDRGNLHNTRLLRIIDKPSKFSTQEESKIKKRYKQFEKSGGNPDNIEEILLIEQYGKILSCIEDFISDSEPNIILDITSLPKRFFFPILKILIRNNDVENLMITYTVPKMYTSEKLVYNCDDWAPLPLFLGEYRRDEMPEMLIINVGFYPMGLQDEIDNGKQGVKIKMLFPFPAPPRPVERSWDFVRKLKKKRSAESFELYHVDLKDMSDAFDRLISLTDSGKRRSTLAPYGPKPISAAMCIFATLTESKVYYTQPTVYHPDYSTGIDTVNGMPATYAYWLRLKKRNFYNI